MKRNIQEKGITLIALVITIIVLLILASITISTLTGENGIINQAYKAQTKTRVAAIEEAIGIWKLEQRLNESIDEETLQDIEELIDDLVEQKLLTEDEKDTILGNDEKGIDATGKITIDDKEIVFIEGIAEVEDFKEYILKGDIYDGVLSEDTLEIHFIDDTDEIKEKYKEKYCENIYQEFFIVSFKEQFEWDNNITFSEAIDDLYTKGVINAKYETVHDALVLGSGMSESSWTNYCDSALDYAGVDTIEVKMYDPDGEETGMWIEKEIPAAVKNYVYKITVNEKEYKLKISIDQYEVLNGNSFETNRVHCFDFINKKCVLFDGGRVIIDDTEKVIDDSNIITENDIDRYFNKWEVVDNGGIYKVFLEYGEIEVEGYFKYLPSS